MGILDKLFGRKAVGSEEIAPESVCPHTSLVPHWGNPEDMGNDERAEYRCESCGATFDYEQARVFLEKPPAALVGTRHDVR